MKPGDLTTLAHVKEWLGITNDQSDDLLSRLITSASKFILNYINRSSLAATAYSDIMDGYGKNFMLVRQWPVIEMTSVLFSGITLTTQATGNPPTNGYLLENPDSISGGQQRLTLFGYCFPKGRSLVTLNYVAGYQINAEPHQVPAATGPYTVETDYTWLADGGVTYANGTAFVKVASSPGEGQYSVSNDGVYTFNMADASKDVLITYSYVPADLEQACWELVGLRYNEKSRIGVQSKTLGGQETVSYWMKAMTDGIEMSLIPYRRVTPQ